MNRLLSLSLALTLVRAVCGLIRASLIAHAFGPEGLGITGTFGQWAIVVASLSTVSLAVGLIHEVRESNNEAAVRSTLSSAFWVLAALGCLVLAALWSFSPTIEPWVFGSRWSGGRRLVFSIGLVAIVASNGFLEGILYAFNRASAYLKSMMIYSVLELALVAILVPARGPWAIIWVYCLSSLLLFVLFLKAALKIPEFNSWISQRGQLSQVRARRMVYDGFGVMAQATVFLSAAVWLRGFVVQTWGLRTNGLVQVLITAEAYMGALMSGMIWNRFHPEVAAHPKQTRELYLATVRLFSLIALIAGGLALVFSGPLVSLIYALSPLEVVPALAAVPVGAFLSAIALANGVILLVQRKPKQFFYGALVCPIAMISSFLIFSRIFGAGPIKAWALSQAGASLVWFSVSSVQVLSTGDLKLKDILSIENLSIASLLPLSMSLFLRETLSFSAALFLSLPAFATAAFQLLRKPKTATSSESVKVAYFSYDGILEPLGHSQVFEYLRLLSKRHHVVATLVTYEKPSDIDDLSRVAKMKERCVEAKINWLPLRYHKSPAVLSTALDIVRGFVRLLGVVVREKPNVLHARSTTSALPVALVSILTRTPWVFDTRGFWAHERIETKIWKKRGLYFFTRALEIVFYHHADRLIMLTENGKRTLRGSYSRASEIEVISTCTDIERFSVNDSSTSKDSGDFVVGYLGSTGNWYDFEATTRFLIRFLESNRAEVRIRTRDSIPDSISALSQVSVKPIHPDQVPAEIAAWSFSPFFIQPTFAKRASQPTRLAEFLAAGVPVITNRGYGDAADLISARRVGVVTDYPVSGEAIDKAIEEIKVLLKDSDVRVRCRQTAKEMFSLETATDSLFRIYREISGLASNNS